MYTLCCAVGTLCTLCVVLHALCVRSVLCCARSVYVHRFDNLCLALVITMSHDVVASLVHPRGGNLPWCIMLPSVRCILAASSGS